VDDYRRNVAAIILAEGGVLACERADPRGVWQCPQGGMEGTELPHEALARELREELAILPEEWTLLGTSSYWRRYRFPATTARGGRLGQQQLWYLVRLNVPWTEVRLRLPTAEFMDIQPMEPSRLLAQTVAWKQAVLWDAMSGFGLLP
jgi:putative (di)nucleoside polyphosphate hydrolase